MNLRPSIQFRSPLARLKTKDDEKRVNFDPDPLLSPTGGRTTRAASRKLRKLFENSGNDDDVTEDGGRGDKNSRSNDEYEDEPETKTISKKQRKKKETKKKDSKKSTSIGRWEPWEHLEFLRGLRVHGRGRWKKIGEKIPTRTTIQVKTHAQVMLRKLDDGINIFEPLDNANDDDKITVKRIGSVDAKQPPSSFVPLPANKDYYAAKQSAVDHRQGHSVPLLQAPVVATVTPQFQPVTTTTVTTTMVGNHHHHHHFGPQPQYQHYHPYQYNAQSFDSMTVAGTTVAAAAAAAAAASSAILQHPTANAFPTPMASASVSNPKPSRSPESAIPSTKSGRNEITPSGSTPATSNGNGRGIDERVDVVLKAVTGSNTSDNNNNGNDNGSNNELYDRELQAILTLTTFRFHKRPNT